MAVRFATSVGKRGQIVDPDPEAIMSFRNHAREFESLRGRPATWFNKVVIEEGQLGSTGSMLRSPGRPMDVRRETVLTGIVETPTQRM